MDGHRAPHTQLENERERFACRVVGTSHPQTRLVLGGGCAVCVGCAQYSFRRRRRCVRACAYPCLSLVYRDCRRRRGQKAFEGWRHAIGRAALPDPAVSRGWARAPREPIARADFRRFQSGESTLRPRERWGLTCQLFEKLGCSIQASFNAKVGPRIQERRYCGRYCFPSFLLRSRATQLSRSYLLRPHRKKGAS